MKRLDVKVCVCTQCVMNGAMEIVESIESLQSFMGSFSSSDSFFR